MLTTNRLIWATVLILGAFAYPAVAVPAGLDAFWAFDEGTGTAATDSSGNGNNGTFSGNLQWVEGIFGTALQFNGVSSEHVVMDAYEGITGTADRTVMAWIKTGARCDFLSWGVNGTGVKYIIRLDAGAGRLRTEPGGGYLTGTTALIDDEWHHIASVLESGGAPTSLDITQYVDGQPDGVGASGNVAVNTGSRVVWIGEGHHGRPINGLMDEVAIFNRALSPEEILSAMSGLKKTEGLAARPGPANKATDVPRDGAQLSWTPGELAQTHDVYIGKSFNDVNDADTANPLGVSVYAGLDVNSLSLDRLDFGTTYYWRVDEVNNTNPSSPWKGNVWQFTVEPYAFTLIPIAATASSSVAETAGPLKTIDGSGLDDDNLHSATATDMWSSMIGDSAPAIWYEFDGIYKLHELLIWNANAYGEAALGIGVKDITIETSLDGDTWTALGDFVVAQGPGQVGYAANPPLDLTGGLARFVRLNIHSNWGNILTQYSLSEVRFSYVPVQAFNERPASGSVDIDPGVVLTWRTGREAARHAVYFGTDAAHLPLVDTVDMSRFDTAAFDMGLGQIFYWRVDEVNESGTAPVWEGETWEFTTRAYRSVDDFESYGLTDEDNPIWMTWDDGYAASQASEVVINGSVAGALYPPYVDLGVAYDGSKQSMPIQFNNTGAYGNGFTPNTLFSEVTRAIPSEEQDWTAGGANALFLAWRGDTYTDDEVASMLKVAPTATDTVYVVVEDNTGQQAIIVWPGPATDLMDPIWHPWTIPFGDLTCVNLSGITNLYLGVGNRTHPAAGGMGTIWVDEIRVVLVP